MIPLEKQIETVKGNLENVASLITREADKEERKKRTQMLISSTYVLADVVESEVKMIAEADKAKIEEGEE